MSRRLLALVLALLLVTAFGACDEGRAPRDEGTVAASRFAEDVCTSVGLWMSSVQGKIQAMSARIADAPREARDAFLGLLRALRLTTDEVLASLDEVGVPEVTGGDEFVDRMTGMFRRARDLFADARADVAALPPDDPAAFEDVLEEARARMEEALQTAGAELAGARSTELNRAFEDEPSCSGLFS